mmetsp:Transcript_96265/g.269364  ORF Transcript_96265/g.269364 Transcript_96265/m.269364 type:complete len:271 (+) Transcript_96265:271-1083(+)
MTFKLRRKRGLRAKHKQYNKTRACTIQGVQILRQAATVGAPKKTALRLCTPHLMAHEGRHVIHAVLQEHPLHGHQGMDQSAPAERALCARPQPGEDAIAVKDVPRLQALRPHEEVPGHEGLEADRALRGQILARPVGQRLQARPGAEGDVPLLQHPREAGALRGPQGEDPAGGAVRDHLAMQHAVGGGLPCEQHPLATCGAIDLQAHVIQQLYLHMLAWAKRLPPLQEAAPKVELVVDNEPDPHAPAEAGMLHKTQVLRTATGQGQALLG